MNFRKPRPEDPEINLIPFIDVLLVVLIFLMLSTTYSKFTELQLTLPSAEADKLRDRPAEIVVSVAADGRYAVNRIAVDGRNVSTLAAALTAAAKDQKEPVVIVSADATGSASLRAAPPPATRASRATTVGRCRQSRGTRRIRRCAHGCQRLVPAAVRRRDRPSPARALVSVQRLS